MEILQLLQRVDANISAIHAAFGAPGDFGYGTKEGDALLDLYRTQLNVQQMIAEIEDYERIKANAI
jgi:hypothetical protein